MATYQQGPAHTYDDPRVEILRQTSMEAILAAEGYDTRHKAKGNYHSPFREDKDPSFHIDETNHRWYDHGTGEGGDTITLVRKLLNKSFTEALDYLEKFNPDISAFQRRTPMASDGKVTSTALSGYVNHSGGAYGSDTEWGSTGARYGVQSKHYYHGSKTPNGNTPVSEKDFAEGVEKVHKAAVILGRNPRNQVVMDLLGRNWMQVRESEAVFAVGKINPMIRHRLPDGVFYSEVEGGTGWAVQMAIDEGKPVYVFDIGTNTWNMFDRQAAPACWERLEQPPVLTKNFAGIGTRKITPEGRKAIEAAYQSTIRHILEKGKDDDYMQGVDRSKQVNVWAGSSENTLLSNMAMRPFVIEGKRFHSVEQRFQYRKAVFFNDPVAAKQILDCGSPYEAKLLGRRVAGFDEKKWDAQAPKEMEQAVRLSFLSNPSAADELLKTGNAEITHRQETSVWKEEFPKILMKVRSELQKNLLDEQGEYRGISSIEIVESTEGIASSTLTKYETEERGIHPDILNHYCSQVKYTVDFQKSGETKKMTFMAVGFPNRSNGWTLRGAPYPGNKSGIKRSTGNDVTVIDKDGNFRTGQDDEPSHKNVVVFEGFNNFLSWLSWREQIVPENTDVVVLNSTVNFDRGLEYILAHENVYTYLDADKTGEDHTKMLEDACKQKGCTMKDCSSLYSKKGLNDFNDAWRLERLRRKKEGIPSKLDIKKTKAAEVLSSTVAQNTQPEKTHSRGRN